MMSESFIAFFTGCGMGWDGEKNRKHGQELLGEFLERLFCFFFFGDGAGGGGDDFSLCTIFSFNFIFLFSFLFLFVMYVCVGVCVCVYVYESVFDSNVIFTYSGKKKKSPPNLLLMDKIY